MLQESVQLVALYFDIIIIKVVGSDNEVRGGIQAGKMSGWGLKALAACSTAVPTSRGVLRFWGF